MSQQLSDIRDRADCERLVRAFYGRVMKDPIIGFIFVDVARLDLEAHVPRITAFWETILLGAQSYAGGAFAPHVALHERVRLRRGHFERWVWLWGESVDALFAGDRAQLAKSHATRVANAFHARLEGLTVASQIQPEWASILYGDGDHVLTVIHSSPGLREGPE
jgi:hemoglobin